MFDEERLAQLQHPAEVLESNDDIKQIILGTASPLVAGHPKPKFSLRMSAQLMFGLIKIYKRQLFFIYDDICHLISRLSAQKFLQVAANIDLNIEAKGDTVTLKNPLEHPDELNPEFGQMGQDTSSVMLGYSQSHYFNVPSNPELDLTSETQEATTVAPEKDSLVAPEWEITIREDDNPVDAHFIRDINEAIPADVSLRDEYLNVNQLFPEPADSTLFSLYEIPQITISVPEEEVAVHRGDVTPCVMPEAVLPAVPSKKDSRLQEDLDETLIEQPVPGQTHRRDVILDTCHYSYRVKMASSNARYDNVDNVSDTLSSSSEISEDEIDLSSCEDYCEEIGGWGKCVEPYKFQPLKSVSEDRYTSNMASRDIRTFFGQGGGDDEKKESERAKKQIEKRKADQKSYDKAKKTASYSRIMAGRVYLGGGLFQSSLLTKNNNYISKQ
ncbi:Meiotic recombination protein REC8 [Nymphon striatum]|nr:Meiotic recombination protein REC8 [Nymphon striatum]